MGVHSKLANHSEFNAEPMYRNVQKLLNFFLYRRIMKNLKKEKLICPCNFYTINAKSLCLSSRKKNQNQWRLDKPTFLSFVPSAFAREDESAESFPVKIRGRKIELVTGSGDHNSCERNSQQSLVISAHFSYPLSWRIEKEKKMQAVQKKYVAAVIAH